MVEPFSRAWFERKGLKGFVKFAALASANIPEKPGVYIVLREDTSEPNFLPKSPAGRHKGKDPTVSVEVLRKRWIAKTPVLNIGESVKLRTRLTNYAKQGAGGNPGHHGGRYIWQLDGSDKCIVAWKVTDDHVAEEKRLLREFRRIYGSLPFANLRL